jgi:hypothetical protein
MCLEISFILVYPDASRFVLWRTAFRLEHRCPQSLTGCAQHSSLLVVPPKAGDSGSRLRSRLRTDKKTRFPVIAKQFVTSLDPRTKERLKRELGRLIFGK